MAKKKEERKEGNMKEPGALFIPAGFLIGFGLGFVFDNVPAGMFLGLGIGIAAWAVLKLMEK